MTLNIQVQTPSKGNNPRADLFTDLLGKLKKDVELVKDKTLSDVDYRFYFDTDILYKNNKLTKTTVADLFDVKVEDFDKIMNFSKVVLDISQDAFSHEDFGPILSLCAVCSGFVTVQNATMQEAVYLSTGRLAHIIENPLYPSLFKSPDEDKYKSTGKPNILWFGTTSEIFSVKKLENEYKGYNIELFNLMNKKSKSLQHKLDKTDIVILPPTFDADGEASRLEKVQFCLMEGKFVVAPELPAEYRNLAWGESLDTAVQYFKKNNITDWISKRQDLLKDMEHEDRSLEQMEKCVKLIPEDDYLDNLDTYLDNEEINL